MEIRNKESKKELRNRILSLRDSLEPEMEAVMNQAIFKKITAIPCFQSAGAVYCYVDCRHEAGTGALIEYFWSRGIRVAVPRVQGKNMDFYYIGSEEDLAEGTYGILEPKAYCSQADQRKAPVIVPGVAFTREGKRLGYGGGYYDRFFATEPEHIKAGIAFDFQVVEEIETDSFDVAMDYVVTPGMRTGFR